MLFLDTNNEPNINQSYNLTFRSSNSRLIVKQHVMSELHCIMILDCLRASFSSHDSNMILSGFVIFECSYMLRIPNQSL